MRDAKKLAWQSILLMGVVSLCGDITYEGARSITGPFLAYLGASAAAVGIASGAGEFIGYALRLVSGWLAARTERYWLFTFIGYGLILSIPLLAFTNHWQLAVLLIILERAGKAIRAPSRDTILSFATKQVGRGKGFGVHEAMDQIGAFTGPLLFSAVFLLHGNYRLGFSLFWIPAVLTIVMLAVARSRMPAPESYETAAAPPETEPPSAPGRPKLSRIFWVYTTFTSITVAGFANFQIISFHFQTRSIMPMAWIPLAYALAMGVDAIVALIIGGLYDRFGMKTLISMPLLTLPVAICAFTNSIYAAAASIVLWGAVMGVHETIMRAAVADISTTKQRALAYGIFNTAYGAAWFVGGALMGILYGRSPILPMYFAAAMQALSIPAFIALLSASKRERKTVAGR